MDSLRRLPFQSGYHAKSGRANVAVSTRGDTVVVYASCDSLQRLCEYYESLATNYKKEYESLNATVKTEDEQRSNPVKTVCIAFIAGLAAGIVLTFLKRKRR